MSQELPVVAAGESCRACGRPTPRLEHPLCGECFIRARVVAKDAFGRWLWFVKAFDGARRYIDKARLYKEADTWLARVVEALRADSGSRS